MVMKINFNRKQKHPLKEGHLEIPYAPAKRVVSRWRWRLLLLIIVSPVIYFVVKVLYTSVIVEEPGLLMLKKQVIRSPMSGVVEDVAVRTGQNVQFGQQLLRLRDYTAIDKIAELRLELTDLDKDLEIPYEQLAPLEEQVLLAQNMVDYQSNRKKTVEFLFGQGAATLADLNNVESKLNQSKYTLSRAFSDLQAWQLSFVAASEREYLKRRKMLERQIVVMEEKEQKSFIKASTDSRVFEFFVDTGSMVKRGDQLISLVSPSDIWIDVYVDPKHVKTVEKYREVKIYLPTGQWIRANINTGPEVVARLPSSLSTPITARNRRLIIRAVPLESIPDDLLISGLPVRVRFRTSTSALIDSFFHIL